MRVARKFIEQKTKGIDENDLVMFVGDMNANAQEDNKKAKAYRVQLKDIVSYTLMLNVYTA